MAALTVSAQDKLDAESAADEVVRALQEGAGASVAEDVVTIAPVFAGMSGGTLVTVKNVMKAIALSAFRRASGGAVPTEEAPTGTPDGALDTFTFSRNATVVQLFSNGTLQVPGTHYTRTGDTAVFAPGHVPQAGDQLYAFLFG